MTSVLVLIDVQRDYFPAALPLVGADAAADRAGVLLGSFRVARLPVIHVRHASVFTDDGFLVASTPGAEIDDRVAPLSGETVVTKRHPNSFRETELRAELDARGAETVVMAGMMTSMCVDATVRAASDFGYTVTVAADACAAPDLEYGGTRVTGDLVHAAYLPALGSAYAEVLTVAEIVERRVG